MSRLAPLAAGLVLLCCAPVVAQDAVLGQRYGIGVHAYFSQNYRKAYDDFTSAISAGSRDPRCYYFRGLSYLRLGREEDAQMDFQHGAELEAKDVNKFYNVPGALERVQGEDRQTLEHFRADARLAALQREEQERAKRYGQEREQEKRLLESGAAPAGAPPAAPVRANEPSGVFESGARRARRRPPNRLLRRPDCRSRLPHPAIPLQPAGRSRRRPPWLLPLLRLPRLLKIRLRRPRSPLRLPLPRLLWPHPPLHLPRQSPLRRQPPPPCRPPLPPTIRSAPTLRRPRRPPPPWRPWPRPLRWRRRLRPHLLPLPRKPWEPVLIRLPRPPLALPPEPLTSLPGRPRELAPIRLRRLPLLALLPLLRLLLRKSRRPRLPRRPRELAPIRLPRPPLLALLPLGSRQFLRLPPPLLQPLHPLLLLQPPRLRRPPWGPRRSRRLRPIARRSASSRPRLRRRRARERRRPTGIRSHPRRGPAAPTMRPTLRQTPRRRPSRSPRRRSLPRTPAIRSAPATTRPNPPSRCGSRGSRRPPLRTTPGRMTAPRPPRRRLPSRSAKRRKAATTPMQPQATRRPAQASRRCCWRHGRRSVRQVRTQDLGVIQEKGITKARRDEIAKREFGVAV